MGSAGITMAPARMISSEHTMANTGRRMKKLTNMSTPLRLRLHRHVVGQHLHAAADDAVAGSNSAQHHVLGADDLSEVRRALPRHRLVAVLRSHGGAGLPADARHGGEGEQRPLAGAPHHARVYDLV